MKKINLLFIPLLTIPANVLVFTGCANNKTETTQMLDLYKSKSALKNTALTNNSDYFHLWTDLVASNASTNGIQNSAWCLEYTLFSYYLFQDNLTIIQGTTPAQAVSLPTNVCINDLIFNNTLQPTFLTRGDNLLLNYDQTQITLSYLGYLHLTAQTSFVLELGSVDQTFAKGTVIEILFSFSNLSFTLSNVTTPTNNNWWSQTIDPTIGNGLGLTTIYTSDGWPFASSNIDKIYNIDSVGNYFGAYKGA